MKQKCQLQIGVAQYENASMPLSLRHQYHTSGLSNEVFDYVLAKRTKKLPLKFDCVDFLSKIDFTSFLWLITFELLELKQSYATIAYL